MFPTAKQLGLALTALTISTLTAPSASAATLVATELFLSVDASPSVDATEFNLQKQGYVDAFRSAEIHSLIASTPNGIAVNFQYWATDQATALGWYHLTDAATANAFADLIDGTSDPGSTVVGGSTNIAGAIASAANAILTNDFTGRRLVIDVSGDGTQNTRCVGSCVATLQAARDAAVADGIVINGLPIGSTFLANYYATNVIGGEGSFNQPANDFTDFKEAVLLKLKREITVPPVPPEPNPIPEPSLLLGLVGLGLWGSQIRKRPSDDHTRA